MPWTTGHAAGFTTAAQPWLPLPPDAKALSVAAQRADPESTLRLTRRLLALRRRSAALRAGAYRELRLGDGLLAYERRSGEERVVVVINFDSRERRISGLPPELRLTLATGPASGGLTLAGVSAAVLSDRSF
ncbi:DUF3459 domain-containing protein [Acrocarpospora macrocephala]|uniref:DUF3459 domain-containing protein n=1 Tax=Acrocarpospora macrocephala TaxID=150177 RepID=UPI00403A58B8